MNQHFLALDALRGLAAVAVLIHHFYWAGFGGSNIAYHGTQAVDFFFILSGFVLAKAYERALEQGRLSLGRFAVKRGIRLYPLIWLGVSAGALVTLCAGRTPIGEVARQGVFGVLAIPYLLSNQVPPSPLNAPAWSLFYELVASALFGLAAAKLPRVSDRWLAGIVAVFLVCLAIDVVHTGITNLGSAPASYVGGGVRTGFGFGMGVLLQRLHARRASRKTSGVMASLLLVLLLASFAMPFLGYFDRFFVLGVTVLLYPLVIWRMADFAVGPTLRPLATLSGDLSYPLYILHWPVFIAALTLLHMAGLAGLAPLLWLRCIVGGVALALSYGALRLYDRPLRARLSRWAERR